MKKKKKESKVQKKHCYTWKKKNEKEFQNARRSKKQTKNVSFHLIPSHIPSLACAGSAVTNIAVMNSSIPAHCPSGPIAASPRA